MKILVWNVLRFSNLRIVVRDDQPPPKGQDAEEVAIANSKYILDTITAVDPDIFVVIEVSSNQGPVGGLAKGEGVEGLVGLLADLNRRASNPGEQVWRVVPPLRLNPESPLGLTTHTEAMGVFWRNDRLEFCGPAVRQGPYPVDDKDRIDWTALSGHKKDQPFFSGKCQFFKETGEEVLFPANEHRRPFLTSFKERTGQRRLLQLYTMHSKPGDWYASQAAGTLTGLVRPPQGNEVVVLAGDFNVNVMGAGGAHFVEWLCRGSADRARLIPLIPGWKPTDPAAAEIRPYSTTIFRVAEARVNAYLTQQCLDFALVAYGAGARAGDPDAVVLDRVRGTGSVATGVPGVTSAMQGTDEQWAAASAVWTPGEDVEAEFFRSLWNYGHIRMTSDHLPVLFVV